MLDAPTARKLGYVPRADDAVLARMLDAGKRLVAALETSELRSGWRRLEMRISLREV